MALIIVALLFIGEIQCIVKAVNSDWGPNTTYKREAIYTGAAITGLGGIVGWFNIEDEPVNN